MVCKMYVVDLLNEISKYHFTQKCQNRYFSPEPIEIRSPLHQPPKKGLKDYCDSNPSRGNTSKVLKASVEGIMTLQAVTPAFDYTIKIMG